MWRWKNSFKIISLNPHDADGGGDGDDNFKDRRIALDKRA